MKIKLVILLILIGPFFLKAQEPNKPVKTDTVKSIQSVKSSGTLQFSIGNKEQKNKEEKAAKTDKNQTVNTPSTDKVKADTASSGSVAFKIGAPVEDKTPPTIEVTYLDSARGFKPVIKNKEFLIQGKVTDASGVLEVLVNDEEAFVDAKGNFSKTLLLAIGDNKISVQATDVKKNTVVRNYTIERVSDQKLVEKTIQPVEQLLPESNYYALIIGNDTYQDTEIPSLEHPISDATQLYNILTTDYVFEPKNVTFLKNATYVQLIEAFDNLSNKITPEDNLLVFYAGHGYWDVKKNLGYWLPVDARKSNTAFWIANSRISDYMSSIKSKHTLLIADACFSGSIFKTRSAFSDAQPAINKLYEMPSRKAMTSGTLKEVPDVSVFLQFLVKRLGEFKEKYISADILFSSFRQAVLNNGKTEPQYGTIQGAGDEGGEFIFIKKNK